MSHPPLLSVNPIRPMGRREFLRAGALVPFGLGLPHLLPASPAARSAPRKRRKAKACIFRFMWGGPAQQDTWDPKPDAPVEYRGEFKPIPTSVPGLRIGEHLPRLARHADELALIRSMTHSDVDHLTATHFQLTGRPVPRRGAPLSEDWPGYGAVLAHLGFGKGPLPPFVSMMPEVPNAAPRFIESSHGQGAGWLGPLYDPLRIDADASKPDYKVGSFEIQADVPRQRSQRRRELLQNLEGQTRRLEGQMPAQALGSHLERAFNLLAS